MINVQWASIRTVYLLTQSVDIHFRAKITPVNYAAVIDHAGHAADGEGATTEAEHPYLVVGGKVLDDELVHAGAFFADGGGSRAVPYVLEECLVGADAFLIAGYDIGTLGGDRMHNGRLFSSCAGKLYCADHVGEKSDWARNAVSW